MAITLTQTEIIPFMTDTGKVTKAGKTVAEIKAERFYPVAVALVEEYMRDSTAPAGVEDEAVIRLCGWMDSSASRLGAVGISKQRVDDLEIEYMANPQANALRFSGAETLLSRFKQRRAC